MARSGKRTTPLGTLRIIGGQWRGRKLSFAAAEGLRPTTDRVRETLFNWLSPSLRDARCLDLFAGSGALGLEALSHATDATAFLQRARDVYDVVFIDPPFGKVLIGPAFTQLVQAGMIAGAGLIYVECAAREPAPEVPPGWRLHREKVAGEVAYRLYEQCSPGGPQPAHR
jgi:16S rRNA (guanine966-N2)-methyltransferase